jgi:hypothetical protein
MVVPCKRPLSYNLRLYELLGLEVLHGAHQHILLWDGLSAYDVFDSSKSSLNEDPAKQKNALFLWVELSRNSVDQLLMQLPKDSAIISTMR